jgi:hypothetical protein
LICAHNQNIIIPDPILKKAEEGLAKGWQN